MRQNDPPGELVNRSWCFRTHCQLKNLQWPIMCCTSIAAAMGLYGSQGASGSTSRPQQHFEGVRHAMMISTSWHASIWVDIGVINHRGEIAL